MQLYVDGMVMPDATSMGMKYQFALSDGEEGVTLCTVMLILLFFAVLCRWYGDARCYLYGNEVPVCVIWWGGGVTLCTVC